MAGKLIWDGKEQEEEEAIEAHRGDSISTTAYLSELRQLVGPQKSPASAGQIRAQVAQMNRALLDTRPPFAYGLDDPESRSLSAVEDGE